MMMMSLNHAPWASHSPLARRPRAFSSSSSTLSRATTHARSSNTSSTTSSSTTTDSRRQLGDTAVPVAAAAATEQAPPTTLSVDRRAALLSAAAAAATLALSPPTPAYSATPPTPSERPTARVALTFGLADRAVKSAADRTLGDRSIIPLDDAAQNELGTVVVALYGGRAPATAANLVAATNAGLLDGTTVSRIIPGEYIQLGRQGARRQGEVELPKGFSLKPNSDVSSAAALRVGAGDRPGTVALSLGENDEDPAVRSRPGYVPFEFFITTGPGPAPRLNDANVAFGRVESGFDVLAAVVRTPTFEPDARQRQLNRFAAFVGDERADKVARRYGRPLRAVVVLKAAVLDQEEGGGGGGGAVAAAAVAG